MSVPARLKRKPVKGELMEPEVDGFVYRPPLCVFCNAPWTEGMISIMAEADIEYGYYGSASLADEGTAKIDITCSTCKRLVYRKEIVISIGRKW